MHQGGESRGRDLARHLSDSNRPAELVRRFPAGNDAAEIGHRTVDHEPGFLEPKRDRLEWPDRLELDIVGRERTAYAQNSHPMYVPEAVLDLLERRYRLQGDLLAAAVNHEGKSLAGARADDALHFGKALDRAAVNGENNVAGLESSRGGGTLGLNRIDSGKRALFAEKHEQTGKNGDRQNEIRQRARNDDCRSLADALVHETHLTFRLGHIRNRRLIGYAGG